jgi:hypothetical protein
MKATHLIVLAALAIAAPAISYAQVAGSTFCRRHVRRVA